MLNSLNKKINTLFLRLKYLNKPYHEYYEELMRQRTAADPKQAIGGMWEEIGNLQYTYLINNGLNPTNTLLDFGCGSLRGGLHFINFLDTGNYFGVDISAEILEAGRDFLKHSEMEHKNPVLAQVNDLEFNFFPGKKFDFILAQSVLTHMPWKDIKTCFSNVPRVMHGNTIFFATFHDGGDKTFDKGYKDFYYQFDDLKDLGEKCGLKIIKKDDYQHPRNQKMMKITLM